MSWSQTYPNSFSPTQQTQEVLKNTDNETKKIYQVISEIMAANGHAHTGNGSDGALIDPEVLPYTPSGGISATTIPEAISELDAEKASISQLQNYTFTAKLLDIFLKKPIVDIRSFGATCDGVTDDTEAFQDAVDSVITNGGTVIIPGTTLINSAITVADPTNLTILGTGNSKIIVNTNTQDAFYITGSSGKALRNFHIKDINIFYPIGASATTGRGIHFSINSTSTIAYSSIKNVRIDNSRVGVYVPDSVLWFWDFEKIEITGAYDNGFVLKSPGSYYGNCNTLKHVYINNMVTSNAGFNMNQNYHLKLEDCAVDSSVIFGSFVNVRGLKLIDCGAEIVDIDSLADYGSVVYVGNSENWLTVIDGFHFHLAPTVSVNTEKYFIKCDGPASIRNINLFGGGNGGSESAFDLPSNIYIFLGNGSFSYVVENVQYRWNSGGRIRATGGNLTLRNITSKITSKTGGTGVDILEYAVDGIRFNGLKKTTGTAAPTTGTWNRGDEVENSSPSASGYKGWICVTGGSPGTWKGYGAIQS